MKKLLVGLLALGSLSVFANCDLTVSSNIAFKFDNEFKNTATTILERKGFTNIDFIADHETSNSNLRLSVGSEGVIPLTTKAIVVLIENAYRPGWGEYIERFEKRTFGGNELPVILKAMKKITPCAEL